MGADLRPRRVGVNEKDLDLLFKGQAEGEVYGEKCLSLAGSGRGDKDEIALAAALARDPGVALSSAQAGPPQDLALYRPQLESKAR